ANLAGADLVVNTTPIGMHPHEDAAPLNETQLAQLLESAVVYDIIYTPRPTLLLKHAADRGLKTLDGLEMLVQQGAIALEKWSGQTAPVDTMRQALLDWFDGKG
ncbi:MAG: shikimate dehydrogenase, partial [Cyanobacteria bacterium P01_D01_bin.73]